MVYVGLNVRKDNQYPRIIENIDIEIMTDGLIRVLLTYDRGKERYFIHPLKKSFERQSKFDFREVSLDDILIVISESVFIEAGTAFNRYQDIKKYVQPHEHIEAYNVYFYYPNDFDMQDIDRNEFSFSDLQDMFELFNENKKLFEERLSICGLTEI